MERQKMSPRCLLLWVAGETVHREAKYRNQSGRKAQFHLQYAEPEVVRLEMSIWHPETWYM